MRNVTRFVVPSRFFLDKFADVGRRYQPFRPHPEFDRCRCPRAERRGRRRLRLSGAAGVREGRGDAGQSSRKGPCAFAHHRYRPGRARPAAARAATSAATVEFTGYLSGAELRAAICSARAVVIPSEWYENAPLSVMEASALAAADHRREHRRHSRIDPPGRDGIRLRERQRGLTGRGARARAAARTRAPARHGRGRARLDAIGVQSGGISR